ncbi:MAG: MFS transporter [Solirubrobacteraceae bacterium]
MSAAQAPAATPMRRSLVAVLAVATGACAANLYYAQPLLHTLAHAFNVSSGSAGLLVTVTQVGYVLGLIFLVPLGDLVERRKLVTRMMVVIAVCLAGAAAAPNMLVFALMNLLIGMATFVAQVIVPLSAHLAAEHERGRVVGMVMSGLLIGILASRTLSGLIAQLVGWRGPFVFGAALMLPLAVILRRSMPTVAPTSELPYRAALRSLVLLIRREPTLRQRMLLGLGVSGCFSLLWTALAFLLSGVHGSPYHYNNATIGLFGLAGIAGALAAQAAGRLGDEGHNHLVTTVGLTLVLAGFGLLYLGGSSLLALIAGIVVLDLGAQASHISNQNAIYRLDPAARSRVTTAYMGAYFSGAIMLSAVAGTLEAAYGWSAVCLAGSLTAAGTLLVWAVFTVRNRIGPSADA